MSADQTVVSNLVFYTGLHRAELIRFGKAVDEEAAAQRLVPDRCLESVTMFDWIEGPGALNLHHLYVNWKERGPVDLRELKSLYLSQCTPEETAAIEAIKSIPDEVVFWWIAPGEGLYFSIDVAATLYRQCFGAMPSTAWVRTQPKGAKKKIDVGEGVDQGVVDLQNGLWVPERFVVVGKPRMEN